MKQSHLRMGVGAVLLAVLALAVAPAALAASSNPSSFVQIRTVDALTASSPNILYFDHGSGKGAPPKIVANGTEVKAGTPTLQPPRRPGASPWSSTRRLRPSRPERWWPPSRPLISWIQGRTGDALIDEQFAIYAANDTGVLVQDFTNDTAKLVAAINQVAPPSAEAARSKSALWSAVRQAGAALSDNSNLQPELLIMSAQADNASKNQQKAAIGEVASANTPVFSWAYTGGGYDPSALRSLSASYGGQVLTTDQGPSIGDLVSKTKTTIDSSQYTITYASTAKANQVVDLSLSTSGQTSSVYYTAGTATAGFYNLSQTANGANKTGVSLLQGSLGLLSPWWRSWWRWRWAPTSSSCWSPGTTASTRCCSPTPRATAPRRSWRRATPLRQDRHHPAGGRGDRAVRREPGLPVPGRERAGAGQPPAACG